MPRVHFRNVPPTVSVEQLRALCRDLGIAGAVHLARDPDSGRYAGEAYVASPTEAEAREAASKLQGRSLGGVRLEVEVIQTAEFFDTDGLFADGEAPMGRQDGD